jgi:hypothetical protein
MVPNLPIAIEDARAGCLPGREAVTVNEVWRAVRRIITDDRRRPPRYVFANEVDLRRRVTR